MFVTTETPYESDGLFEAVNVIGVLGTDPTSTRLAEIGYALSADRIQPYDWLGERPKTLPAALASGSLHIVEPHCGGPHCPDRSNNFSVVCEFLVIRGPRVSLRGNLGIAVKSDLNNLVDGLVTAQLIQGELEQVTLGLPTSETG